MSGIPLRLNALGNVEISSASGVINHNAEVVHNHANDSVLADLKALKSTLGASDLFMWNGSNVVAQPSGDFAQSSDLAEKLDVSVFETFRDTSVPTTYLRIDDASTQYATVSQLELANTAISGKAESSALSSYLTTADASTTYVASSAFYDDLEVTISNLDSILSTKAVQSDLTDLQTVVSGKASASDLSDLQTVVSGKASASDLSDLQTVVNGKADILALDAYVVGANLGYELTVLPTIEVGQNNTFKHNKKQERVKQVSFTDTFAEVLSLPASNSMAYFVDVECVYKKSDLSKCGSVKYSAVWKKESGTCSYVEESLNTLGDTSGEEFQVINVSGNMSIQVKGSTKMSNSGEVCVCAKWVEC